MKKLLVVFALVLASPFALANPDCEAKALSKEGKPLHGAAKNAFMKKCTGDVPAPAAQSACESKAVGKDGQPLHGAAKGAFMKKCTKEAQATK
jgi:hypothetical protein